MSNKNRTTHGTGINRGRSGPRLTEVELIFNRADKFYLSEEEISQFTICSKDRKGLTTD